MTNRSSGSDTHMQAALDFWRDYQVQHDVSAVMGQAVGIDPESKRVWFGVDAGEVARKAKADGNQGRLLCLRVGKDYYWRKGTRR